VGSVAAVGLASVCVSAVDEGEADGESGSCWDGEGEEQEGEVVPAADSAGRR